METAWFLFEIWSSLSAQRMGELGKGMLISRPKKDLTVLLDHSNN